MLKSQYDPREDRMLLVLAPTEGERRLWVTRRLWLALYREIAAIAPALADESAAPAVPPMAPGERRAVSGGEGAAMLQTVQIKRHDGGAALVFASDDGPVTLSLREPGLAQLRRMLEVQADRAGWDVAAALERLQAESIAGAAVRRART